MKNIWTLVGVFLVVLGLITGCTKTWSGMKQDTNKAWKSTKKVVHEATA